MKINSEIIMFANSSIVFSSCCCRHYQSHPIPLSLLHRCRVMNMRKMRKEFKEKDRKIQELKKQKARSAAFEPPTIAHRATQHANTTEKVKFEFWILLNNNINSGAFTGDHYISNIHPLSLILSILSCSKTQFNSIH